MLKIKTNKRKLLGRRIYAFLLLLLSFNTLVLKGDDGYRLWLRYDKLEDSYLMREYQKEIKSINLLRKSEILSVAGKELKEGLNGLLGIDIPLNSQNELSPNTVLVGTSETISALKDYTLQADLSKLNKEGYIIRRVNIKSKSCFLIAANDDKGVLYGVFHFLRLLQTQTDLKNIAVGSSPKLQWRMLNHWDNPDGRIERGYAGQSIWKWDELPEKINQHYVDYARANASIGINGVVINSVNASSKFLDKRYLKKVAALANIFRSYGIHVFLSANFAAPKALGDLDTADPLAPQVRQWWADKVAEIYELIPDFGGFLVKANSEGQPGPQDYGRSHVEGANMMADALAAHKGVLIWRAFVYSMQKGGDRAKQAYNEFASFDGEFRANVFVQTKNGPLDFQPREPVSPLFGAMPKTAQMLEFQITQEYLGFSTHLVYLAPLFKETLEFDTYAKGKSSTVAKIIDGGLQGQSLTGMAGVSNIGDVRNWTAHPFAQANWYAYGRLAWDYNLSSEEIAEEWIKMTLSRDVSAVNTIRNMMMISREALVNYETPLGLNVLTDASHFGPQPWKRTYYHRVDSLGLGYDRSSQGSDAVSQYFPEVKTILDDVQTCPENLLAWFHHVPWNHRMQSGRTFWQELSYLYYAGVDDVRQMRKSWRTLKNKINGRTFKKVKDLLDLQEDEAVWWRDANLWYFGKFSQQTLPPDLEKPRYNEEEIKLKDEKIKYDIYGKKYY